MPVFIPLVEQAWTFLALHIQEHFFWPEDLTPHQQRRLDSAKWWITLMGAIVGLALFRLLKLGHHTFTKSVPAKIIAASI